MPDISIAMENSTIQTESLGASKKSTGRGAKIAIVIVAVVVLSALVYVGKGLLIAATVDGRPISRLAVIQKLEKASGKTLLNSLITEKLIQNEAKAKKIAVSDDEVNAVIKGIEDQLAAQGGTLDAALAAEGMRLNDLKKQIILQKELEKLVADKINVTDEEVAQYIKDKEISVPAGQEATISAQTKDQLRSQKLAKESEALIVTLKSQAKILYFVNY